MPSQIDIDNSTPQPRAVKAKKAGNKSQKKKCNANASQKASAASASPDALRNNGQDPTEDDEDDVMGRLAKAREELKVLEVKKAALAKEINEASAMVLVSKIERPKEQSIREGMGLAGNKAKYDAIRRLVRDLCAEVGINWELAWAEVPDSKKVKLCQAARQEVPYLKQFANDWPVRALAMQLMKNKRGHAYCCKYLKVPESTTPQSGGTELGPEGDTDEDDVERANIRSGALGTRSGPKDKAPRSAPHLKKTGRGAMPQSGEMELEEATDEDEFEPTNTHSGTSGTSSGSKHAASESITGQHPKKKQKSTMTARAYPKTRGRVTRGIEDENELKADSQGDSDIDEDLEG